MSDTKLFLIAVLITAVIYPFYFKYLFRNQKKRNEKSYGTKVLEEGVCVQAKIVKIRYHPSHGRGEDNTNIPFWTVVYEYQVEGKAYRKKYYPDINDGRPEHNINMYYLKGDPGRAVPEGNAMAQTKRKPGCLSIVVLPVVWILVIFYISRIIRGEL